MSGGLSAASEQLEMRRLLAVSPELDTTFGEGGIAQIPTTASGEFFAVKELSGGKILAAGSGPQDDDPIVARFNADGTPDLSFDGDGKIVIPQNDPHIGFLVDAAFAPDGKVLILYYTENKLRVFRFNADGTIDHSFGSGGVVTHTGVATNVIARTIAAQTDGKVLIGWVGFTGSADVAFLSRLNADGSV